MAATVESAVLLNALNDLERMEDQYQEVARALGSKTFFHKDVLARARELAVFWEGK